MVLMVLIDNCGRPLLNLRVAITQKCNLNCTYCHREGEETINTHCEMTVNEIVHLVRIAVDLGLSKVKLTGGEPLVRKDIIDIVKNIAEIKGLKELSMTSNGILLAPLAEELYNNGLNRVNISLPTLHAETFKKLTGGKLRYVLESVEAAVKAKLDPVKLNMTILKGINDQDVNEMIEFAGKTGAILQIIELEPLNMSDEYYLEYHKSLDDYELLLKRKALKINYRRQMQNRAVYTLPNATVEVVHPIENTDFCNHCTRLRITSEGKLKPCLMREDNLIDILTPMRSGASDKKLIELFKLANKKREPYYKGKRL